jgi:hypothetical protein
MLVATGFVVLTSFIGLLSFCLEQSAFRIAYAVCVVLVMGLQIAWSAIAFPSKDNIINAIGNLWKDPIQNLRALKTRRMVEKQIECCVWKNHRPSSCGCHDFDRLLVDEYEPKVSKAVKNSLLGTAVALVLLTVLELAP